MALTLSVGGGKSGFDRESFLSAMEDTGIPRTIAGRLIRRLCDCLRAWFDLIDDSFLSPDLKASFKRLLSERVGRMRQA